MTQPQCHAAVPVIKGSDSREPDHIGHRAVSYTHLVAGALKPEMVKSMNQDPIVFAMANPTPEIMYEEAIEAGVKVMGTGRSDFPNQINNVLAFPGIFRGALDAGARDINYDMKVAAAYAIAELVEPEKLCAEYIIPAALDPRVAPHVAVSYTHLDVYKRQ